MTRHRSHVTSIVALFVLCLFVTSCGKEPEPTVGGDPSGNDASGYGDGYDSYYGSGEISFVDDVKTNADLSGDLSQLMFVDIEGHESTPADYAGGKHVVLVITRGNTNPICPFCTTQTSRLISNYGDFQSRNAEVLVVYPIEHNDDADRLSAFLEASKNRLDDPAQQVPFPILLDVELKAVDQLGIRKDLSKPATYILDADGTVRFAYVGARLDDRPSIKALLAELDKLATDSDAPNTE